MKVLLFVVLASFFSSTGEGTARRASCATLLAPKSSKTQAPRKAKKKAQNEAVISSLLRNDIRSEVLSRCTDNKWCSLEDVSSAVGSAIEGIHKRSRTIKGISAIVGMYGGVVTVLTYLSLDESFPRYVIAPITMLLTPILSAMTAPVTEWISSRFRHVGFGISTPLDSDPEIDEMRKSYEALWKVINAKLSENAQIGRNNLNSSLTAAMISLDSAWWSWNENTPHSQQRAVDLVALAAVYMRKVFPDLGTNLELANLVGRVYFSDHLGSINLQELRASILKKIHEHDGHSNSSDYYKRLLDQWLDQTETGHEKNLDATFKPSQFMPILSVLKAGRGPNILVFPSKTAPSSICSMAV